jgi:hypothetical protein
MPSFSQPQADVAAAVMSDCRIPERLSRRQKHPLPRCAGICEHRRMSAAEPPSVTITLTPAQIDTVVRAASRGRAPSVTALVGEAVRGVLTDGDATAADRSDPPQALAGPDAHNGYMLGDIHNPRLSRSLVRGLSILTCFGPDARARGIVELADDLGMSASTAHRYATTLVELGLLERCPQTRKYRPAGV